MKTSKKISLVMLAGLISAMASFGAYVLMPYLFNKGEFSVSDADSHLASDSERVPLTRMEKQPEIAHDFVEATPMETAGEKTGNLEESSPPTEFSPVQEVQAGTGKQPSDEPVRVVEERVLAYSAPEGGHSFSKIESIQEADLVAGFDRATSDKEEDEESKKKRKDKKVSSKKGDGDSGPDGEEASVSQLKKIAGAKAKTPGGDAEISAEATLEPKEQVATVSTAAPSPAGAPDPDSRLRSRVGSNGRVFVGGGWYSNGAAGNVKGLVGGTQSPTVTQPVRIDSRGRSGVPFDGNSRVTGLPAGIESGGPVGFRSVIQNSSDVNIRRGSIGPANARVTSDTPNLRPVAPRSLPSAGVSDGRVNAGAVRLP